MTIAVIFFGNAGAGKSTLLSQIGGRFQSGVKFREGYTKDVYEDWVKINGKDVLLMDVPGLFEPNDEQTQYNASKLTEALNKGYHYKLYFVLKASNRGPDDAEMVMMAKVNEHVKQANGAKVSFRVIINQIPDQSVYNMYQEYVARDNFKSLFKNLNVQDLSFDIKIDNVTLVWFNTTEVQSNMLRNKIAEEVEAHHASPLSRFKKFVVSNVDLATFAKAVLALAAIIDYAVTGGIFSAFGLLPGLLSS
ncbi:hypothetical protein BGX26_009469 [Mortierella sp. AD094]|nr:hypothetical protein BGX26_009469 [Mortierella sp. AD094]